MGNKTWKVMNEMRRIDLINTRLQGR